MMSVPAQAWCAVAVHVLTLWAAAARALGQDCEIAKLVAPNGAPDDWFGRSVSIWSNLALIGTPNHKPTGTWPYGSAWLFERNGSAWGADAQLNGDNLGTTGGFGASVAIQEDRLVVGAPGGVTSNGVTGAAYVFEKSADEWRLIVKLAPADGAENDAFGLSVVLDGDTVAIAAPEHDKPAGSCGAVYVFERQIDGTWPQVAKLSGLPLAPGDKIGWDGALAISGDVIVAGSPFNDTLGWAVGCAYVFERDAVGAWSQTAKLLPWDGVSGLDFFGGCAGVHGGTILVGSVLADGAAEGTGAVYTFERNATGSWAPGAKLYDPAAIKNGFAKSVCFDGNMALVGAMSDGQPLGSFGAVYAFRKDAQSGWTLLSKFAAGDLEAGDEFGYRVSLSGSTALIGTFPADGGNFKPGAAYVFAVGPDLNSNGLMDPCECPGDLNKDWIVDQADLGLLLANWGCTGGLGYEPSQKPCPGALTACCGDLDADGDVDQADLGVMLQNFGNVCP